MKVTAQIFLLLLSLVIVEHSSGSEFGARRSRSTINSETSSTSPCARASHLISTTNSTDVPAQLAYDCLNSVPLNLTKALELHQSLYPYLKWQTTLSYVKNPPGKYSMPAFDFWAALNEIGRKLFNSQYTNEYAFGLDLGKAFISVHDAHFSFIPDIVAKVFSFRRRTALVSVSLDRQAPRVYVQSDISRWVRSNQSAKDAPSDVVAIDSRPINAYLFDAMQMGIGQDSDALYNDLFWVPARQFRHDPKVCADGGFSCGLSPGQPYYPGASTTLEFSNGTSQTHENYARLLVDRGDFAEVGDGLSFYQKFCTGDPSLLEAPAKGVNMPPYASSDVLGYPQAAVKHSHDFFSGYLMDSDLFHEVAVLRISRFANTVPVSDHLEFQAKIAEFLVQAKATRKSMLILDLRANTGGAVGVGFDVFQQLFPESRPLGVGRSRAFDTMDAIGKHMSDLSDPHLFPEQPQEIHSAAARSIFNYRNWVRDEVHDDVENITDFASWSDLYGPESVPNRDNFTHLNNWNLSVPELFGKDGIRVGGLKNRSAETAPPFDWQNMVMIHDGLCASTCSVFTELLRLEGVLSIAIGGQPRTDRFADAMQSVGQTKGSGVMTFEDIWLLTTFAWATADEATKAAWQISAPDLVFLNPEPIQRGVGRGGGSVNIRDSILPKDDLSDQEEFGAPSQFMVRPADCQIWYTPEMMEDANEVWTRVALTVRLDTDAGAGCEWGLLKKS